MSAATALDRKKLQQLEKLFKTEAERELEASKRIKEITVLESELNSLQPGARVYRGDANTVLFQAELVQVKSGIKKELAGLRKVHKKASSSDLAF